MKINQKLNKNAQKWVDALAHGKYKQCKDKLHVGNAFCCLGVACELAIKNGVNVDKLKGEQLRWYYNGALSVLPLSIMNWLGLNSIKGAFDMAIRLDEDSSCVDLTELNDKAGYSFEQIAAFINADPKGLFMDDKS